MQQRFRGPAASGAAGAARDAESWFGLASQRQLLAVCKLLDRQRVSQRSGLPLLSSLSRTEPAGAEEVEEGDAEVGTRHTEGLELRGQGDRLPDVVSLELFTSDLFSCLFFDMLCQASAIYKADLAVSVIIYVVNGASDSGPAAH